MRKTQIRPQPQIVPAQSASIWTGGRCCRSLCRRSLSAQGTQRYLKPIVAGLNSKPGDPSYESIARISKILKEKYDVQLEMQVHPSSVLGNDLPQLDSVQTGFIDITSNVTAQFEQYSKAFTFVDLPYAVTSWDMAERLFASDLWKEQAAKFEADSGLVPLPPVGGGGFRLLWNSRRATPDPSAIKGLKYRDDRIAGRDCADQGLGRQPDADCLDRDLQRPEEWPGRRHPCAADLDLQLQHVRSLQVRDRGRRDLRGQFQVINKNSLNSMPPAIRQKFLMAAADAAKEANEMDRKLESEFRQKLVDKKMEIHKPSAAELKMWQGTVRRFGPNTAKASTRVSWNAWLRCADCSDRAEVRMQRLIDWVVRATDWSPSRS